MVLPYCSFPEREESRDQAPLYPPLQRAGGQVVSFIVGPLSFDSGQGGFYRLPAEFSLCLALGGMWDYTMN